MKTPFHTRVAAAIMLTAAIFCLPSCDEEMTTGNEDSISELKDTNWRDNIGREVTVDAFLSLSPEPALLTDMEDNLKNEVLSESRYLRLRDPSGMISQLDPEEYHGARVTLRGTIMEDPSGTAEALSSLLGDPYLCILDISALPQITDPSDFIYPGHFDPCDANPAICDNITVGERQTYVMLYSGGINSSNAHLRYWNDLVFFHFTLTWILGVDASNIKVIYKNGVGEDNFMPVHYAATVSGVNDAFAWFDQNMGINDRFVLYLTNHGGHNYADTDNDEADNDDEAIFYYNQSQNFTDDDLASKVNDLSFSQFIGIFEPCYAGGLMRDLSGANRVMVSASTENQVSWGGYQNYGNSYDHFVFFFTSALAGQFPDGTAVDADANNDGKVSMGEAFEYARINDPADEIPQIESDGDGVPSNTANGELTNLAFNVFIAD